MVLFRKNMKKIKKIKVFSKNWLKKRQSQGSRIVCYTLFLIEFIKLNEFDIKYKVGSGAFSIIYLATKDQSTFALKQLSK